MDLLLEMELYEKFFFRDNLEFISELDVILFNIIQNRNKKLILNKKMQDYLLQKADNENKKHIIRQYFKHLIKII